MLTRQSSWLRVTEGSGVIGVTAFETQLIGEILDRKVDRVDCAVAEGRGEGVILIES